MQDKSKVVHLIPADVQPELVFVITKLLIHSWIHFAWLHHAGAFRVLSDKYVSDDSGTGVVHQVRLTYVCAGVRVYVSCIPCAQ